MFTDTETMMMTSSIPKIKLVKREAEAPDLKLLNCDVCKCQFQDVIQFKQHEDSTLHELRIQYRKNRKKFIKKIPFMEITDFKNAVLDINEPRTFIINFKNIAKEPLIVNFVNVYNLCDLRCVYTDYIHDCSIENDSTFNFKLKVNFSEYGAYLFPVVFEIKTNTKPNEYIHLLIEPMFQVLSKDIDYLKSFKPYKPIKKLTIEFSDLPIIKSEFVMNSKHLLETKVKLFDYKMPRSLKFFLDLKFKLSEVSLENEIGLSKMRSLLCDESGQKLLHNRESLNKYNYVKRFRHLLWFEEHQMSKDMATYYQSNVNLKFHADKDSYELSIPGLAEGRPSILKGDRMLAQNIFDKVKFEGVIYTTEENSVFLKFHKSFKNLRKDKLDIEFLLDRFPLRMCHRALDQIENRQVASLLFPSKSQQRNKKIKITLKSTFNEAIKNNEEQMTAIKNIIENRAYPAPYILFGPPGTGKTATIVETITQMWFLYGRTKKICVCAPSNSAADLITERLLKYHVPAYEIFRIYSLSRSETNVSDKLKKCSNYDRIGKELFFPSKKHIKSKSIVIITPITAGKLISGGFSGGHFHYLFMDEVGHSIEPEMIIPIIGLLTKKRKNTTNCEFRGSLVLAGDPKQLGPVIRSTLAVRLGFDMSLLERLMIQCKIYEKDLKTSKYNPTYITKLVHNYRSHEVILHVPNMLFYDNELKVAGDINNINCASQWIELKKFNFPLIFHGVQGVEEREENSPSYFNRFEIKVVTEYLNKLVNRKLGTRLVQEKDIGIITPYRKQVQKLNQYLKDRNMSDITVASVEEFQGQERLIIIITTVRSRFELVATDYQFGLGFLRNAKRFNVAVTRAIALLIIIGNPNILQCDPNWRTLIQYCIRNDSYIGEKPFGSVPSNFDASENISTVDLPALIINSNK